MEEGRRRSVYIPHSLGVCCLLREKCNLGPKSFYAIRNKFKRIQVRGVIHQHSQYLECHFGMSYATWTSIPALTISYHPQLSAQLASTTHFSPLPTSCFIFLCMSVYAHVCVFPCAYIGMNVWSPGDNLGSSHPFLHLLFETEFLKGSEPCQVA